MKSLLVLLLTLIGVNALSQQDVSWYKMAAGSIDKYPVTMHLHKAGNVYRGFYYYNSQQRPIYFSGNDTAYGGSIGLLAFSSAQDNEIFTFTIDNNKVSGEWKKAPDSLPLHFNASVTASNFAYIFTIGSEKLRPNLSESPEGNYSAASIWPTGNSSSDRFLKNEIRKTFVQNHSGDDEIGAILLEEKKSTLKKYISENVKTSEEDMKEMPSAFSMDEQEDLMICYKSNKIISLAHLNYAYTGGAHGNYGTTYSVISLSKNKKLQLSDVIPESKQSQLNQLLEKNFRLQYNLKPTDKLTDGGLFENSIKANDNFYVTGKGIGFNYVPYEIGPYVMGEINIFIPFTDLKISPKF